MNIFSRITSVVLACEDEANQGIMLIDKKLCDISMGEASDKPSC